jgi:flavin-binding protein dodecin
MSDRTYRVTEIVGTSPDGIEPAIGSGVRRAAQILRHLDWFEVTEIRGQDMLKSRIAPGVSPAG